MHELVTSTWPMNIAAACEEAILKAYAEPNGALAKMDVQNCREAELYHMKPRIENKE